MICAGAEGGSGATRTCSAGRAAGGAGAAVAIRGGSGSAFATGGGMAGFGAGAAAFGGRVGTGAGAALLLTSAGNKSAGRRGPGDAADEGGLGSAGAVRAVDRAGAAVRGRRWPPVTPPAGMPSAAISTSGARRTTVALAAETSPGSRRRRSGPLPMSSTAPRSTSIPGKPLPPMTTVSWALTANPPAAANAIARPAAQGIAVT